MPTSVRMEPVLEARYSALASETGRSKAFYINRALEDSIDRLEYEFGILGDAEACRAGRMRTYSLAEAGELLGLDS